MLAADREPNCVGFALQLFLQKIGAEEHEVGVGREAPSRHRRAMREARQRHDLHDGERGPGRVITHHVQVGQLGHSHGLDVWSPT